MNSMNKLVKPLFIDFELGRRILVMSDTHGNYHLVNKLLKRNNYSKNDYLLVLGDLAAKGPYPLKTLRYFMNLSKYDNVYIIMGNCDESDFLVMEEKNIEQFEIYLKANSSLIKDMYNELAKNNDLTGKTIIELQKLINENYQTEFEFIKNLPHVIISDKYIFTHARVPQHIDVNSDSYKLYVGGRRFYLDGHDNEQIVIAGHMPVNIFKRNINDDNILFLDDKKMVLIDGGMTVRDGGQINLLEIDLQNNKIFQLDAISGLRKKVVKESQASTMIGKGISWPFSKIRVLEKGEYFTKCLIEETLEIAHIKNEYISQDQKSAIDNCPAGLIEVSCGDVVEIIDDTTKGYSLVKKDGVLGWLKNENIGGDYND